jgi:hypothetical protein
MTPPGDGSPFLCGLCSGSSARTISCSFQLLSHPARIATRQLADDVHFLTAPLRFIWRSILWFVFLFFAPAIFLVVPLAVVHFFPGDDAIGLLKVLLGVLGPFACAFLAGDRVCAPGCTAGAARGSPL